MHGRSVVGLLVVLYLAMFVIARCDMAVASSDASSIEAPPCVA